MITYWSSDISCCVTGSKFITSAFSFAAWMCHCNCCHGVTAPNVSAEINSFKRSVAFPLIMTVYDLRDPVWWPKLNPFKLSPQRQWSNPSKRSLGTLGITSPCPQRPALRGIFPKLSGQFSRTALGLPLIAMGGKTLNGSINIKEGSVSTPPQVKRLIYDFKMSALTNVI